MSQDQNTEVTDMTTAYAAVADQGGPWGRPSHSPTLCFRSPWGGGAAPRGSLARLPPDRFFRSRWDMILTTEGLGHPLLWPVIHLFLTV